MEDSRDLTETDVSVELESLERAFASVTDQLRSSIDKSRISLPESANEIVLAQLAILDDGSLREKVRDRIVTDRSGAHLALRIVSDQYVDLFKSLDDPHIQEKAADLQDVCDRLLNSLSGKAPMLDIPRGSVIVAHEIWPTTLLSLSDSAPAAIITETGGWTSHSFILARELGIPAISGVRNATKRLTTGENVFVDAVNGTIVTDHNYELPKYQTAASSATIELEQLETRVKLSDGTTLQLLANVDSPEKCRETFATGVHEIGLLRSEYLFSFNGRLPDESTQTEMYREIASDADGKPVAIRTFDVSIGQIIAGDSRRERNPALGMRSIRLTLKYERQYRAQIRALLRANVNGNLSIVIPMVSGAADARRVRSLIESEFESLHSKDSRLKIPSVGAMIELPSAVLTVDQILDEVDFVCIGTNDLVQYTLGVDRDNETVADWYQTLHPSILRSIRSVISSAADANKPATVCGESAGSPFYLPLLLGLGVRRLSMNPSSIPSIIKYVQDIDIVECQRLAEKLLTYSSSSQIEKCLAEFCFAIWPELSGSRVNFPPSTISKF